MGRNASRVDAMHAKSSITITSTVRHGGLSTSTIGACGRVGQNKRLSLMSHFDEEHHGYNRIQ